MTHSLQAGRFGSFPLPQRKTPVAIATCTEWKMVQKFQRKSFWVCFDGTVRIVPFSKRRRCGSRRGRQGARWAALSGQKVPLRGSLASGSEAPPGREPLGRARRPFHPCRRPLPGRTSLLPPGPYVPAGAPGAPPSRGPSPGRCGCSFHQGALAGPFREIKIRVHF